MAQQRNGFTPNAAWQVPGFGVVKQLRTFELDSGRNTVSFTDVAAFLDPTTVGFRDLTDPGTSVLEQSFQFDLVSPSKLLEKYLDRSIWVLTSMGDTSSPFSMHLSSSPCCQRDRKRPAAVAHKRFAVAQPSIASTP